MSTRHSIIKIRDLVHPSDCSRIYLVQVAVDDVPCVPFYSHEIQRRELGEDGWLQSLYDNAEMLVREYGASPALT